LLGSSLDRRLAAGRPPESHLLLAARAQRLASPVMRLTLAHEWADLVTRARSAPTPRDPRVAINRDTIVANEPEIRMLLDRLVAPMPIPARGIAAMRLLLSDGVGPLYDRRRSGELHGVLAEVTALVTSEALFPEGS
jgi:hypothetical protein